MEILTKLVGGHVYTPSGVLKDATVIVKDGRIADISLSNVEIDGADVIDASGLRVVPGGIDLHIHGGAGRDYMEATEDAFREAMESHVVHGTTSICPTLGAGSFEMYKEAIKVSEKLMAEDSTPMLGLHFEGPYLNKNRIGALDPKYARNPLPEEYEELMNSAKVIKRFSVSPELPGVAELGACLRKHNVLGAVAHTLANYEQVKNAFDSGYTLATHFYNAMSGFHQDGVFKHEGVVESVYVIPEMDIEIIADGKHVPPVLLKMAYMFKGADKTALITDALSCSACGTGKNFDPRVIIEDGVCKLSDRSALAGSVATMDVLVKTMTEEAGVPFADVITMTSATPARIAGVNDRKGSLVAGKDADIVFYDDNLNLRFVMQKGRIARPLDR